MTSIPSVRNKWWLLDQTQNLTIDSTVRIAVFASRCGVTVVSQRCHSSTCSYARFLLTTLIVRSIVILANGKPLTKLNQVDMKFFDFETCSQPRFYGNLIWDNMLCFGNLEGGKGTCQGDSGGPLVCYGRDFDHWTLRGLVSWAKGGCAAPDRPTVFTNVAHYTDWIEQQEGNFQDNFQEGQPHEE